MPKAIPYQRMAFGILAASCEPSGYEPLMRLLSFLPEAHSAWLIVLFVVILLITAIFTLVALI